jgi:hypothetical protein
VQTAVIAATAAAVGLLGVIIAKKRSGKSDDEIKDDLKRSVCSIARVAHFCMLHYSWPTDLIALA